MASKKLILGIIGVAAVGFYFYDKNKKESGSATAGNGTTTGPRVLTDAEALAYLNNNYDLLNEFGAGNIEKAKWHYQIMGWQESAPRWKP